MINFPLMNKLSFFLAFLLAAVSVNAQQTADKIVAVVGKNRIVLASDIEAQALQMKQQDPASYSDAAKCQILQQMILQKMLVEQAARDSVVVGNEEVDATLD